METLFEDYKQTIEIIFYIIYIVSNYYILSSHDFLFVTTNINIFYYILDGKLIFESYICRPICLFIMFNAS